MGVFHANCPTRALLDLIADRWTVLVMLSLHERPHRFAELRRRLEGVSQRMLTVTLRRLERNGLVHRDVQPTRPPQVTYSLTALGASLVGLLGSVRAWAEGHIEQVTAAQQVFDDHAQESESA